MINVGLRFKNHFNYSLKNEGFDDGLQIYKY